MNESHNALPNLTSEYLLSQGLSLNFPDRFFENIEKTDTCWWWKAAKDEDGYGMIRPRGRECHIRAHRASYILYKSPIPTGKKVCHTCDNPSCVNPNHLFLGTYTDNNRDRKAKGRSASGERHPRHKLTLEQVQEIRAFIPPTNSIGRYSGWRKQLASKYGVSVHTIGGVRQGTSWCY